MPKQVTCPICFYTDALLENDKAEPGTLEYIGSIFCPYCESGLAELEADEAPLETQ